MKISQLFLHKKWKVLFLTTSLGKKLILPTFRLDALVLLIRVMRKTRASSRNIAKISFLPSEVVKKRTFRHFKLHCNDNFQLAYNSTVVHLVFNGRIYSVFHVVMYTYKYALKWYAEHFIEWTLLPVVSVNILCGVHTRMMYTHTCISTNGRASRKLVVHLIPYGSFAFKHSLLLLLPFTAVFRPSVWFNKAH